MMKKAAENDRGTELSKRKLWGADAVSIRR